MAGEPSASGPSPILMRHVLLLVPLIAVGCAPSRQAAISNAGRVASTAQTGTFVAGVGKVGPEAEDVAWSPDGATLAYSTKRGTCLWPGSVRIPNLRGPLAWSPDGKRLAGERANGVAIWDSTTKRVRDAGTLIPQMIRWMPDGRALEVDSAGFQVEGMRRVVRDSGDSFDAVPTKDGTVVWLETGNAKRLSGRLDLPVLRGTWSLATGRLSTVAVGRWGSILGAPTPVGLTLLTRFALAPNGERFAAAGLTVQTSAASLARLKALADLDRDPTPSERREYVRLSNAAGKRSVVALVEGAKPPRVLWSEPLSEEEGAPTDLEWSADGRWLAVALPDRTVRLDLKP